MTQGQKVRRNPWRAKVVGIIDAHTLKVDVERMVEVPLYGKRVKRSTTLLVDANDKKVELGEYVNIVPCRPLSKRKCWKVVDVLGKNV